MKNSRIGSTLHSLFVEENILNKDEVVFFYSYNHPKTTWMSCFYNSPIVVDGKKYGTVEHYYQASKASNVFDHERVRNEKTPTAAKRVGRKVITKKDWQLVRLDVMRKALFEKFSQHKKLKTKLLNTGDKLIYEDSDNKYWGYGNGTGENWMGKLLVATREDLKQIEIKKKYKGQIGQ